MTSNTTNAKAKPIKVREGDCLARLGPVGLPEHLTRHLATYELEQQGDSIKLTVIHEIDKTGCWDKV